MARDISPPPDLQGPLHNSIANELIALTPDSWRTVHLRLVRAPSQDQSSSNGDAVSRSIVSPEGKTDVVVPSERLLGLTRELDLLFQRHGAKWVSAQYVVAVDDNDDWSWDVSFEYGPPVAQ